MDVLDRISQSALIPVVVLDNSEDALPTANALLSGGVDVMEITFRTDAAAAAIRTVSERCPTMLVGAGTVLNLEQCRRAVELGARFLVSPGFDPAVVRCGNFGVEHANFRNCAAFAFHRNKIAHIKRLENEQNKTAGNV